MVTIRFPCLEATISPVEILPKTSTVGPTVLTRGALINTPGNMLVSASRLELLSPEADGNVVFTSASKLSN